MNLRSVPVAIDSVVAQPAEDMEEQHRRFTGAGFLALHEPGPCSERPVDEAAWWIQQQSHKSIFRLLPDGGSIFMRPEKFKAAEWRDEDLVVEVGAFQHRITRLIRRDGSPPEVREK